MRHQQLILKALVILLWQAGFCPQASAQKIAIPRAQDRPPGPALSPEEAVKKMTVPEGFTVEIVAAEPDVVNPVAMCIDEQGRFWITESLEYPRREAGPGRDRIKVLEDTDQDGRVDKTTIFAEGLNIPSGINVGHGGVWICNAPDLLFMQDTDGDLKADKTQVLLTGWGRDDTHELPNSLTWGPDGWLYGLNGVFNYSHVKYGKDNPNFKEDQPGFPLTCALWRIHPRTKQFEIFAEGTSNPWGIAINEDGEFFLSACVIDHLWHITQTGYYIRQGGPYPPHTWPIGSIVKHKHQKAAYCGITWFDSDAYPEEYRKVFYMGNIHGGCINADIATPLGSTYEGKPHPGFPAKPGTWAADVDGTVRKEGTPEKTILKDLLTANDPWFMPVVQKVGPDGCLYILDWYDRYHCYQDANADPEGIEREKGRLYRLRYKDSPRAPKFDLAKETDEQLIERLGSPNVYFRETAQRVLQERSSTSAVERLTKFVTESKTSLTQQQRHAMWTLIGSQMAISYDDHRSEEFSNSLESLADPYAKAWGIRLHTAQRMSVILTSDPLEWHAVEQSRIALESNDVRVRMQGVIFATKLMQQQEPPVDFSADLSAALARSTQDPLFPHIIWNSCLALIQRSPDQVNELLAAMLAQPDIADNATTAEVVRRIMELSIAQRRYVELAEIVKTAVKGNAQQSAAGQQCLKSLTDRLLSGEIGGDDLGVLEKELRSTLVPVIEQAEHPLRFEAAMFAQSCRWAGEGKVKFYMPAISIAFKAAYDAQTADPLRLRAVRALIASNHPCSVHFCGKVLDDSSASVELKSNVLAALSRSTASIVGQRILDRYKDFTPDLQSKALELLTQRPEWSTPLIAAIVDKQISKDALNLNQLRRVASFKDETLQKQFKELYGVIREGRSPDREQVINSTRDFLYGTPGDPANGHVVFKKVCANCHKMYGEGAEVGPDITNNGRASFEQILSNVLDPSLVIGNAYQARQLLTKDGRTLTGLPVEESDQRVVLKVQGGKQETISRDQIEEYKVSELSMMPEALEKQLTPQELADLFSFIGLDKPPTDKDAKRLPGVPTGRK